jgi:cobalamin biosynthesis Mg chelatase CobN
MHRPRHPRSSAPLAFSLLSVLALLAFAALPNLAQAECIDSSCVQYETDLPETGAPQKEVKPTKHQNSSKKKEATASGTPKTGESSGAPEIEEGEGENSESSGHPGTTGGGDNKPPSGGNQSGNGKPNAGSTGLGENESVTTPVKHNTASTSSGGGSSPLVPILIAVAVLAAISIGAVLYKQRRSDSGDSGASVSPKAG